MLFRFAGWPLTKSWLKAWLGLVIISLAITFHIVHEDFMGSKLKSSMSDKPDSL